MGKFSGQSVQFLAGDDHVSEVKNPILHNTKLHKNEFMRSSGLLSEKSIAIPANRFHEYPSPSFSFRPRCPSGRYVSKVIRKKKSDQFRIFGPL